jgi:hypothetical protein
MKVKIKVIPNVRVFHLTPHLSQGMVPTRG